MSEVCGLFHDIGRFEQWRRFETLVDAQSVDHGDLGAEILSGNDYIQTFSPADTDAIIQAVKYHNKYKAPDALQGRSRILTDIVRDADKIDILYLLSKGELLKKSHNSDMSESVFQRLLNGEGIRPQDIKTKADRVAVYLAFPFDFRYRRSFELVEENDYINKLIDIQEEEEGSAELGRKLETLRRHLERYIEENIHAEG